MGSGASTTLKTSLLQRIQQEIDCPTNLCDITGLRQRTHMVDEVKRLRSLIALANSGRRMKELESSMEESEPIATQILRVRNRAREKQKNHDSVKRKEKKEKFESMLKKIPRRNIKVEAALANPGITAAAAAAAATTASIAATTAKPTSCGRLVPQHHTVVIVDGSPAYTARLRRLLQRVFYGGANRQEGPGVKVLTFAGQWLFCLFCFLFRAHCIRHTLCQRT